VFVKDITEITGIYLLTNYCGISIHSKIDLSYPFKIITLCFKENLPMTLTKADLIDSIQKNHDLPRLKCSQVVETVLEIIKDRLENGEDILVSGFGKFCVKDKRRRRGRNPATGADLMLDARRVIIFKCSGVLRDKINEKL